MELILIGVALPWLFVGLGCWVGYQLIRQNGRLLLQIEALRQHLAAGAEPLALLEGAPLPAPAPVPSSGRPAGALSPDLTLADALYGRIMMRLEALEQRLGLEGAAPVPAAPPPSPAPAMPAGLPVGSAAPAFDLPDLEGERRSLAHYRGRRLLLIFFNPRCGFCTQMGPDLAALPTDGPILPLVVTTGELEENRTVVREYGIGCPVLLQEGMEVASRYQANGTPMGYLLDEQGNIASELAVGAQALLALTADAHPPAVGTRPLHGYPQTPDAGENGHGPGALGGKRSVEESKLQRHGLPAGTPAPSFRLPLLHGGELALEEYRGRRVLLVFSDPNCGPCDALVPQLEQLARRRPDLQVLMVSRGEAEANRAKAAEHGLTFPIVLQRQWEISREYAMFGTPIGYLIDAAGIIAADPAVGMEPILALAAMPTIPTNGKVRMPRPSKHEAARRR